MSVYQTVNAAVLERVPPDARAVLDLGCGGGAFGAAVKARQPCRVVGVTYSEEEARIARTLLDAVQVADLDDFDPRPFGRFDCIVCSHVLEHLHAPQALLEKLVPSLAPTGCLIVALPNVLFWRQRLAFLRGEFRYTDGGLMDRTHLRFFDWAGAAELVGASGLRIVERSAEGHLPLAGRLGPALARRLNGWALERYPGLLGFQFVLRCVAAPRAAT